MKLGNYSSVHLDSVDQSKIDSQLRGDTLMVGLDVAKTKEYAALADDTGQNVGVIRWKHPWETREFADFVDGLTPSTVQVVMEPTGSYGDPLRHLAYRRGWQVFKMAPKRVHDSREIADGVPSIHDSKAAHLLLWLHGQGLSERWLPKGKERRMIKTLTRRLSGLQVEWQRHLGYLEAEMARFWPEILQAWDLRRATLLGVLQKFGGPQEIVDREDEVRVYMKKKGGPMLSQERIDDVMEAAHNSLGVDMLDSELLSLQNLAERADRLRRDRSAFRRKLEALITGETILRIADEVGTPTAAVFWDKVGPFQDYQSPQGLIKAFGLNLKERSSGNYSSLLHVTKRGDSGARASLYLATWRKINDDPYFHAWYKAKVDRDGGENKADKNVSVVALMRKYLQGLWHLARGEKFDSSLLFDVNKLRRKKGVTI